MSPSIDYEAIETVLDGECVKVGDVINEPPSVEVQ
jgi:hypothetical protein